MRDSLATLVDLLARPEFQAGLIIGSITLLGMVATSLLRLGRRNTGWDMAITGATLAAVYATLGRRLGLTIAILALVLGGHLLDQTSKRKAPSLAAWSLIIIGSTGAVFQADIPRNAWVVILLPAFIVGGGLSFSLWKGLPQHDALGPAFAISSFGIWATVPDTDVARALLGVSLILSLSTLRPANFRVSLAGGMAITAIVAWVAAAGGATRHGAILGALGTMAVILLMPHVRGVDRIPKSAFLVVHSLMVLLSARAIGLWESALPAAIGVAVASLVSQVTLHLVAARQQDLSTRSG